MNTYLRIDREIEEEEIFVNYSNTMCFVFAIKAEKPEDYSDYTFTVYDKHGGHFFRASVGFPKSDNFLGSASLTLIVPPDCTVKGGGVLHGLQLANRWYEMK